MCKKIRLPILVSNMNLYCKVCTKRSLGKCSIHMVCKEGQFDVVMVMWRLLLSIWMLNMRVEWLTLICLNLKIGNKYITCTVTRYSRGEIIVEWRREREEFVKPDQREISMTLCWIIDAPILNLVPETHSGLSCYCLVLKLPFQSESHSCKGILIIRMIKSHPMNIIIPIWHK